MKKQHDLAQWLQQGLQFYKSGNLPEAEAMYRQAIEADEAYAHAWFLLGMLKWKQQLWEETTEYLMRAIERNPNRADYRLKYGQILHQLKRKDEAWEQLDVAIELHDQKDRALMVKAKLLQKDRQFEQAEVLLNNAIEVNPTNYEAFYQLGNLLCQMERFFEAEPCFLKAIEGKFNLAQAYLNLGMIAAKRLQGQEAFDYFQQAQKQAPSWVQPYEQIARLFLSTQHWMPALQVVQQGLALHPQYIGLLHFKMAIYHQLKSEAQVAKVAKQILEIDPNHVEATAQYGLVLRKNGNATKALGYLKKATAMKSQSADFQVYLGDVYVDLKELEQAYQCFEQAIELKPNHFKAHYQRLHLKARLSLGNERNADEQLLLEAIDAQLELEEETGGRIPIEIFNYFDVSPERKSKVAQHMAKYVTRQTASIKKSLNFQFDKADKKKLRVAYLIPKLDELPIQHFIQMVTTYHRTERFELCVYTFHTSKATLQEFPAIQLIQVANWSYPKIAKRIYDDETDILIDLAGYRADAKPEVVALQAAPVQAQYMGIATSLATASLPYLLAHHDDILESNQSHFLEEVLYLPQLLERNSIAMAHVVQCLEAHYEYMWQEFLQAP